jgi:cleavage and polyadenylation specificity factor subunit 3
LKKSVESVLDVALATISSLSESYTTGITLRDVPSLVDEKDEDAKNEGYFYQIDEKTHVRRQVQLGQVKEGGGYNEEEDGDDSDEIVDSEVIE